MKKFIIIFILILGAFVGYLKYPLYKSGIEDTYFDTNYSSININSKKNGMITFKDFEDSLYENKEDFEYFSRKFSCENGKNLEIIDPNNIPSKCSSFKKYVESEEFKYKLIEEKTSLKGYEASVGKKIFIHYLNEKKIIENLDNKDFLVYTSKIKSFSNIDFQQAKASYIIYNITSGNKKKAIDMLYNSIKNEIYILNNSHLDTIKFFTFETRLKIYVNLLEKCLTSKKLTTYDKKKFKLLFINNSLEEDLMEKSLRTKYYELVNNFDKDFRENYLKNLKSNNIIEKVRFNVETFLFVDFLETKELYKKYYKESLEQKKLTYTPPILPKDIKNYIGKKIIGGGVTDYKSRFKQYERLQKRMKDLENSL